MTWDGKFRICLIAITISLGGSFHFGYQLSSLNPSESVFRRFWHSSHLAHYHAYLDEEKYRLIWSIVLSLWVLGHFLGAPFLVFISERLGRKNGLFLSSFVMCVWFVLESSSKWFNSLEIFALARFLMGLGEGWTVGIQSMYLSQTSPKEYRGLCGGITGAFVELGFIAGAVITLPQLLGTDDRWPFVYLLECGLLVIMWISLPFLHESPKYLVAKATSSELVNHCAIFDIRIWTRVWRRS